MDQYKKLTVNTIILMIGTMGSKLITFLMLPFYTNILSTTEYGTIDIILQISNFLVPVCTLGITAGIIRFGLDSRYKKNEVFTTGILCFGIGLLVCLIIALVTRFLPLPDGIARYIGWILILIAASSLHSVCGVFVRSQENVRLFTITGILNTVCNVLLMILFLKVFQMGIRGYVLAVTLADVISVLFLAFASKLWRFVDFRRLYVHTTKEILGFSIPTIPATISWWLIEMSDRFMVTGIISVAANGIYAVAAKIPSIVAIVAGVFISAWQISIIKTTNKQEQTRFYSNIMRAYGSVLFVMAGFVTLFSRILITILTSSDYYEAWEYVPLLIGATVFSCLANFIGNIYTVEKKSIPQLVTTLIGAAVNIALNWLLIPRLGIYGAVIATFASFLLLFIIRMADTRKYMKLDWSPLRFCASTVLLLGQTIAMTSSWEPVYPIQAICLAGLIILNYKPLLAGVKKVISARGHGG